jgi:hypothetical protein
LAKGIPDGELPNNPLLDYLLDRLEKDIPAEELQNSCVKIFKAACSLLPTLVSLEEIVKECIEQKKKVPATPENLNLNQSLLEKQLEKQNRFCLYLKDLFQKESDRFKKFKDVLKQLGMPPIPTLHKTLVVIDVTSLINNSDPSTLHNPSWMVDFEDLD